MESSIQAKCYLKSTLSDKSGASYEVIKADGTGSTSWPSPDCKGGKIYSINSWCASTSAANAEYIMEMPLGNILGVIIQPKKHLAQN